MGESKMKNVHADNHRGIKKPFYRKWWVWLLIIVGVYILFSLFQAIGESNEQIFLDVKDSTVTLNKKAEANVEFTTNKENKYTLTDVASGKKLASSQAKTGHEGITMYTSGKYKLTVFDNGAKESKIITVKPLRIKASELTDDNSSTTTKTDSKSKAMNFGQGDMVGNGDMVASITVNSVQLVGADNDMVVDVSSNYDGMQQYAIVNYTVKAIKGEIPLDDFDGSELSIADSNGTIGTQSSNRDPGTPDTLSEGQSADLRIGVGLKHSGNDMTIKFNNLTWKGQAQ